MEKMILHREEPDLKARLFRVCIFAGALLALGIFLVVLYRRLGFGIPCAFYHITGKYCPGCGTMRAMNALLELDFAAAFRENLLTMCLAPVLAVLGGLEIRDYLKGRRKNRPWEKPLCIVILLLCILFGVLRNLPGFWFLQPY